MSNDREPSIIAPNRDELAYLLTEAAEIEHGLMCSYLYAAYSLKRGEGDGLTPEQAAATARWRAAIVDVAIDEMLHLALVNNLLAAIGCTPHFQRANFPVAPGYHPAGVVVSLAPFDRATIDHFVFLERPEGIDAADGDGFESPVQYARIAVPGRLVPSAQDYATVGHLYRGLRAGFAHLTQTLGEGPLFVGDPSAQVGDDLAPLQGLVRVTNLASAERAIDTIVEQGEGSPANPERSHYRRFLAIREELGRLEAASPGFLPAHPAARNPVMRKPPEPKGKVYVDDPESARVLDFGNAVYAFALRCLARAFGEADDPPSARRALIEASLLAMRDLAPVMELLCRLPASASQPGVRAGLTFTMQRSVVGFSQQRAAWAVLAERAREIGSASTALAGVHEATLRGICKDFAAIADRLEHEAPAAIPHDPAAIRHDPPGASRGPESPAKAPSSNGAPSPPASPTTASTSPASGPAPSNAAVSSAVAGLGPTTAAPNATGPGPSSNAEASAAAPDGAGAAPAIEEARSERVVLRFEAKRCIHSRFCVLTRPDVFLANVKGPWLHPEAATPEGLAEVAHNCPSGAITYRRLDGGEEETAPRVNVLRIRENGPLAIHAAIRLNETAELFRATLCRCGASANKPFCDGSHHTKPFLATGEPSTEASEPLLQRDGPLEVVATRNGPLQVKGNLEICSGTGRTVSRVTTARLCRCGGSSKKPFCDGTHARIGFKSE